MAKRNVNQLLPNRPKKKDIPLFIKFVFQNRCVLLFVYIHIRYIIPNGTRYTIVFPPPKWPTPYFFETFVKFASFTFIVLWGIDKLNHWGIELLQDVDMLNHD